MTTKRVKKRSDWAKLAPTNKNEAVAKIRVHARLGVVPKLAARYSVKGVIKKPIGAAPAMKAL
tara:strand:- start:214 stop:402 length:189 start_codon:yes stop_codon:yes gene_type:complete